VTILSPSPNTLIQGIVPVFIAIPAQADDVWLQLRNAWGESINKWHLTVTPSAASTTVQVNAEIGTLPTASYSLIATASVNNVVVTSDPVPVRAENTTVAPPPAPPQTPVPPQTPTPGSPVAPGPPSRTKAPTAGGTVPTLGTGNARPRPQAQPVVWERALARSTAASTSSQAKAGAKSLTGAASKTQKSTAPATGKSTSLPAGTVVIGLGTCSGPDPYAKNPTLKGECVSGTWFPRVRKAEPRRQQ